MRRKFSGTADKTFLVDSLFDNDKSYVGVVNNRTGVVMHHTSMHQQTIELPEPTYENLYVRYNIHDEQKQGIPTYIDDNYGRSWYVGTTKVANDMFGLEIICNPASNDELTSLKNWDAAWNFWKNLYATNFEIPIPVANKNQVEMFAS